jgi:hypothetical protein
MTKIKILLVVFVFASCNQKEMTLQELEKAKWDSLARGVYYISKEDQKQVAANADSIELKLKGMSGKENTSLEMSFENIPDITKEALNTILKQTLLNSRSGYLKINFREMLRPELLTGMIYLRGDYSGPDNYDQDSAILTGIDEIRSFSFISKEEAKKKYLADGGDDWEKVLKENPLPNAFEIVLEKKDWTEESLNKLKNKIHERILMASDISFPMIWIKKPDYYFFFAYKRK